jgi:hypothetical protein
LAVFTFFMSSKRQEKREELARRHGFSSFAELVAASKPLPIVPPPNVQAYIAQEPDGTWFVWDDVPKDAEPGEDG